MATFPKSQPKPWIAKPLPFSGHIYTTFYSNAAWRRLRRIFLEKNPLCQHCQSNGIITPAVDIDHIQSINPYKPYDTENGKYGNPLDETNLQALCKKCHHIKTAKTRGIETRTEQTNL